MVNPAAGAQRAGKVGVLEAEMLDWILTRRDQELWKGPGRKATSGLHTTKGGRWLDCGVRERQTRKKVKGKVTGAVVH